jgi:broad specificity phosphatase PhoE
MVTTLYLIRHGETEGSGTKCYKGSIDVPLSERGIEQIARAAEFLVEEIRKAAASRYLSYLKDIHSADSEQPAISDTMPEDSGKTLAAVYCSHLIRAAKSAEIIASAYGLKPVIVPDLRERSFGIWEGMSFTEIKEKYPVEFEAWANNPLKYSPINGESTLEVKERTIKGLDDILAKHKGESVAIVAHGGINRIILCHIMGIPLENIFRIEQSFAAINIIEFWGKYPVVKGLNLTPDFYGDTK